MTRLHRSIATFALLPFAACGGAPPKPAPKAEPVAEVDPASIRPAVAPIGNVRFPTPSVALIGSKPPADGATTESGVELITVPRTASPAIHFRWVIPGGRALEFGNQGRNRNRWPAGTTSVLAEMMVEGTRQHRGASFAAALERHGATLDVSAASDAMILSGRVLSHQLRPFLALVAEALLEPELDGKLLETRKKQHAARLQSLGTRPREVAGRIFNRVVYGGVHPYGAPGLTAGSVRAIDRRHLVDAHRAAFGLRGSSLVMVGDVDPPAVAEALRESFGSALERRGDSVGEVAAPTPEPVACHVFDVPEAVQSVLVLGNPATARAVANWPQLVVANQILGGSASSRLFTVLRERKGLTYGIYSSLDGRLRAGDWSLSSSVRTPKTAEALDAIAVELDMMRNAAPSAEELGAAQRYLVGQFVAGIASSGAVASRVAAVRLYGLPEGVWSDYAGALEATDVEKARAEAQQHFGATGLQTVVVGDLAKLRPELDNRCARIDLRDADGERVRTLVGPDADMTDADRKALFAAWGATATSVPALERFVHDTSHAVAHRTAALFAQLGGPNQAVALKITAGASDAPELARALAVALAGELRDDPIDRARAARAWLLDMVSPASGAPQLVEEDARKAHEALARYAFAGVSPDSPPEVVKALVPPRLDEADLARLGAPSVDGLEALVSADVWREPAARALIAQEDAPAVRALVRAYRRSLVVRRVLPAAVDLELLSKVPDVQTALLLLDTHALLELAAASATGTAPRETESARVATMTTLRGGVETMASTPSREANENSGRSVLERDIKYVQSHLEALLGFRDTDDRWWAATLLVHNRGVEGLRLVLAGMADDDRYGIEAFRKRPTATSILMLAEDEIAPLGVDLARPLLLAALAGRNRVAKALAVTTMRVWGDDGSLTALRTHIDATDLGSLLDVGRPFSVTELARAAVDVHRVLRAIRGERESGAIDDATANRRSAAAMAALHLSGAALDARVAAIHPPPPPKATNPAPTPPGAK